MLHEGPNRVCAEESEIYSLLKSHAPERRVPNQRRKVSLRQPENAAYPIARLGAFSKPQVAANWSEVKVAGCPIPALAQTKRETGRSRPLSAIRRLMRKVRFALTRQVSRICRSEAPAVACFLPANAISRHGCATHRAARPISPSRPASFLRALPVCLQSSRRPHSNRSLAFGSIRDATRAKARLADSWIFLHPSRRPPRVLPAPVGRPSPLVRGVI